MAKIPIYESKVGIVDSRGRMAPPGPEHSSEAATISGRNLAELGGAVQDVGKDINKVSEFFEKIETNRQKNAAAIDETKQRQKILNDFLNSPDPIAARKIAQEQLNDMQNTVGQNIANSLVRDEFKSEVAMNSLQTQFKMDSHVREWSVQQARANAWDRVDNLIKEAYTANPDRVKAIEGEINNTFEEGVQVGTFTAEEARSGKRTSIDKLRGDMFSHQLTAAEISADPVGSSKAVFDSIQSDKTMDPKTKDEKLAEAFKLVERAPRLAEFRKEQAVRALNVKGSLDALNQKTTRDEINAQFRRGEIVDKYGNPDEAEKNRRIKLVDEGNGLIRSDDTSYNKIVNLMGQVGKTNPYTGFTVDEQYILQQMGVEVTANRLSQVSAQKLANLMIIPTEPGSLKFKTLSQAIADKAIADRKVEEKITKFGIFSSHVDRYIKPENKEKVMNQIIDGITTGNIAPEQWISYAAGVVDAQLKQDYGVQAKTVGDIDTIASFKQGVSSMPVQRPNSPAAAALYPAGTSYNVGGKKGVVNKVLPNGNLDVIVDEDADTNQQ